jgi:hypothetical protein
MNLLSLIARELISSKISLNKSKDEKVKRIGIALKNASNDVFKLYLIILKIHCSNRQSIYFIKWKALFRKINVFWDLQTILLCCWKIEGRVLYKIGVWLIIEFTGFKFVDHCKQFLIVFDLFDCRVDLFIFLGEFFCMFNFSCVGGFFSLYALCNLVYLLWIERLLPCDKASWLELISLCLVCMVKI